MRNYSVTYRYDEYVFCEVLVSTNDVNKIKGRYGDKIVSYQLVDDDYVSKMVRRGMSIKTL